MPRRGQPTVSAIMPVHDPNLEHMAWTLDALENQDYPIRELIVIDSSPGAVNVEMDSIPTKVLRAPDAGIADARELGIQNATGDYIVELDEDAVMLREDYITQAVESIQTDGTSAAGGVVIPIRGNVEGRAIAFADRFNPSSLGTHNLVYPRTMCLRQGESMCHPMANRGEDITLRRELQQYGRIHRMNDQGILKDLPTTRQELSRNAIVGTIIGGVIAGIGSAIAERIVAEIQEEGREVFSQVA